MTDPGPPTGPRRRRLIVVAASALIVVLAITGTLTVRWWHHHDEALSRSAWQPAPQAFLTASMRVQPVPGWHISLADLGVAASATDQPARIATAGDAFGSSPLVGSLGDEAFFIAVTPGEPHPQWWLTGSDVRDGSRLFPAVRLGSEPVAPKCFRNGPDAVLCISEVAGGATAWVVDVHTGTVIHTGPTDLRTGGARLAVRQVGDYAVAETQYQGVYGLGPQADTTWFVPGNGSVNRRYPPPRDTAPETIASQSSNDLRSGHDTVFALSDGTVITPDPTGGSAPQAVVVYPGGFAGEIIEDSATHVYFFDDHGARLGRAGAAGTLDTSRNAMLDLPVVLLRSNSWAVYTADGNQLLTVPGIRPGSTRRIGTRLFVEDDDNTAGPHWQQYDLRTGGQVMTCQYESLDSGYIGTDGTVVLLGYGNPIVTRRIKAYDLDTCELLWQETAPVGSYRQTWRINTTLVQLSDDATELASLVAPR